MNFNELKLNKAILQAIKEEGYENPSPIQKEAIPHIMNGKDVLGCAQTGTGKTATFALPLINNLMLNKELDNTNIKVLILTPTRELAIQIRDNFRKYSIYTDLKCSVIFGGVNQTSQIRVLKRGVDILVATPGRLLDLLNQRHVKLNSLKALVLDEADTMLDMGFINDVKKIISHTPKEKQTLLFSATMPDEIKDLATNLLKNHMTIKLNTDSPTVEKINQSVYHVDKGNKSKLLLQILKENNIKSVLIFVRTKHNANKLNETLQKSGITSGVIHGNKSQSARVAALTNFKTGKHKVLVATDIAARGIDISELSHVINYEIPEKAETYVHRIGRTGRAGFEGTAISLCDKDEIISLRDIERLIKLSIPVIDDHNYVVEYNNHVNKLSENKNNKKNKNNRNMKQNNKNNSSNKNKHKFNNKRSNNTIKK